MLRSLTELTGYHVDAVDGVIGHVTEVYFDDRSWTVRYLVVNTGTWLNGREVLLSPLALGAAVGQTRAFTTTLTKARVEGSPIIDLHKPVSRQHETEFNDYFGWPAYWEGQHLWGRWHAPSMFALADAAREHPHPVVDQSDDPHLRSSAEVARYHLHATDGTLGTWRT